MHVDLLLTAMWAWIAAGLALGYYLRRRKEPWTPKRSKN